MKIERFTLGIVSISMIVFFGCSKGKPTESFDISEKWRFRPDPTDVGCDDGWFAADYDDKSWDVLNAGTKWEEQGYPDLDGYGWYRKAVEIPSNWRGKDIWIRFEAVNDAYHLYINGTKVSYFGEANISMASRPTYTEISKHARCGKVNHIALRIEDWGGSGGLWQSPVILTTDENDVTNIFKPITSTRYTPEELGYDLYWEDHFEGDQLDPDKWAPRGVGPRAAGYVSTDAIRVKDGILELAAFIENDSVKVGAVGTQATFMTTYGYFECRAQVQKSRGNWSAFWIQSPGIAQGEDPGEFGTEIDIFEFFKKSGEDMVSHNLHWAYGPNQQSIGGRLSHHEGVSEGFHTFALEWTPDYYAFFIDGFKYYEIKEAISHTDEYMILSMELPATMEGLLDATLPDVYLVDYVKVYKKRN